MAPTTKQSRKRVDAAFTAFNTRYSAASQWGEERWNGSLYPALAHPTKYCAVLNLYATDVERGNEILLRTADGGRCGGTRIIDFPSLSTNSQENQDILPDECQIQCYEREEAINSDASSSHLTSSIPFPVPKADPSSTSPLLTHWNLDAASVLAAHMLDVCAGDAVLDMCAAPGGKAVVLAQKLFPHLHQRPQHQISSAESLLHVNEFDTTRYKRLTGNLKSYLPAALFPSPEHPHAPIKIFNKDLSAKQSVSMLPLGTNGYNKILIDAPCSSERHIIHAREKAKASGRIADEMLNWKASHVTTLVKVQVGLLQTALKAVKIGGRIVYATCALGYEENDGVVEKVLEGLKADRKKAKRDGRPVERWDIELLTGAEGVGISTDNDALNQMTEPTRYGRIALPDHGGRGPLYFCVMVKVEKKGSTKAETKTLLKSFGDTQKSDKESKKALTRDHSTTENEVSQSLQRMQVKDIPVEETTAEV